MKILLHKISKLLFLLINLFPQNIQNKNINMEKRSLLQDGRDEIYRPQIHFTPFKNWMNDPNGFFLMEYTIFISNIIQKVTNGEICHGDMQLLQILSIGKNSQ